MSVRNYQRGLESEILELDMILNAVGMALDGQEPSDFELSFPIVRKAWDLHLWRERAFEVYPNIDIDISRRIPSYPESEEMK